MDRAGDKFFTSAAFAGDQNGRLDLGHRFDHLEYRLHLPGIADNVLYAPTFALGAFECAVFVDQSLLLDRLLDDQLQLFDVERFLNEIVGAELVGAQPFFFGPQ